MNTFNKNILWASLAALALTGCGSSSDDHDDNHDEHDHESSILMSQSGTTTLSLLEEGALEALDDAASGNGASLVLSETGAVAAVVAGGTVSFVQGLHDEEEGEVESEAHEEHEEEAHMVDLSLTGTQAIATSGHFAVLNDGMTTFVAYDELESESPVTEVFDTVVGQDYPALIPDEDHELVLAFDGTDALIYEGTIQKFSAACANPSNHAQGHEVVVLSCDAGAVALIIEEGATEHTFESSPLTLDGTASNYVWRAQGEVIVGFEPNTSNYVVVELNETSGELELVKSSDTGVFEFSNAICDIQLDSQATDILAIAAGGTFVALDHEAQSIRSITLDESAQSTCGDFVLASAAKAAVVVDNAAQMIFEIDVDDVESNPNAYHVHGRESLSVSDIASMVIFHEVETEGHEPH